MFNGILYKVQEQAPHIHCITNYVTANDCANIVLACGAHPVMADSPYEVEDITAICDALVINMGTLHESKLQGMVLAGKKANEKKHPVILDPVGVGAASFRTKAVFHLLNEINFSVIRGNISEILTLYNGFGKTKGVDIFEAERITEKNVDEVCNIAILLAVRTKAVIVITGSIDVVTDGQNTFLMYNGHPSMSKVSGTGCMLSSVIGAMCGVLKVETLKASVAGVAVMGVCGEIAYEKIEERKEGTASLKIHLIDAVSTINEGVLKERAKYKVL